MVPCWSCRILLSASSVLFFLPVASPGQAPNCLGTSTTENPAAREEINRGVDAYKAGRYEEAISHLDKATNLAPCLTMARQYLATAQAQNVVPGLDTPDNLKTAQQALANFQIILSQDPHDVNSLKQVAGLYFSTKKFEDARDWQKKVLAENSHDYEASYTIGVIDWTLAHGNALKALSAVKLNDDGEGNSQAPPEVLASIKRENLDLITEAMQYLTQAIADHPDYDDAMAYLNLVYRRKADLDYDDPALRDQDIAEAKEWVKKAMATRKENEEKKLASPDHAQP